MYQSRRDNCWRSGSGIARKSRRAPKILEFAAKSFVSSFIREKQSLLPPEKNIRPKDVTEQTAEKREDNTILFFPSQILARSG